MEYNQPRINDPRFLFFNRYESSNDWDIKLNIELDYRYLRAPDLAGLLLERVGLESFNLPHALDTIEDNVEAMDGALVTIFNFHFDDNIKANDLIGIIQVIAYIISRGGARIRFYLDIRRTI
jgi:hypothetical protein